MRNLSRVAALAFAVSALGCNDKKEDKAAKVEETGVDFQNNPLGALGQLAEAGKEMQKKAEEMKNRKPVDPIDYQALVKLLPKVEGWESAKDPQAETTSMGEFKISNATQRYEKKTESGRSTMKVSIVDGSYVPMVYAPFTMMSKFSREGTDGHSKGLEVEGFPAFEEWKKKQESVTLSILVQDRFLVTIEGRSVPADEARTWASKIPLRKLGEWANKGVTGKDVSPPEEESDPAEKKPVDAAEESEKAPEKAPE